MTEKEFEIYAHRGASAHVLENTWDAFRKACEMGVGIELDVQITKDGVVVVFHDGNLKRLSGVNMEIAEVDYEKMKDIKIGKRGFRKIRSHKIPLAYEVFQWAKSKSVPLNIELKGSFSVHPEGTKILAAMLEGIENIHFSSFEPSLLKEMKRLMPKIETALIFQKKFLPQTLEKMDWVDSIHLHKKLYSDKLLEQLAEMKKNVRVYGMLGTEKTMSKLNSNLVGIITDHPDRVKEKLRLPE